MDRNPNEYDENNGNVGENAKEKPVLYKGITGTIQNCYINESLKKRGKFFRPYLRGSFLAYRTSDVICSSLQIKSATSSIYDSIENIPMELKVSDDEYFERRPPMRFRQRGGRGGRSRGRGQGEELRCKEMGRDQKINYNSIGITGKVKWFNVKRGYGFVCRDDNDEDVFISESAIVKSNVDPPRKSLKESEEILFDIAQGAKGNEYIIRIY